MLKTILVVDDSAVTLTEVDEALKDHYQVITLNSAARMFEAINAVKADLILLDVEMPDMNGFEAVKKLKDNIKTAHIPVIFLTSMNDNMSIALGVSSGATDYIMKPFTAAQLLQRVQKKLENKV